MTFHFDGRVAIVTGAGNGLGRAHALGLASRGARVVVNDLGAARDGSGHSSAAAEAVVEEICAAGGEAMANGANVTDAEQVAAMVEAARARWGRVDILVNNAGILRDKSFQKASLDDFRQVIEVHLMGTVICTQAVWGLMREQGYGRVVMTTSSSGLYGNFGQANYGAAKMAVVGLMNTLHLEGAKYDIRVNALAPTAFTRMTGDIGMPEETLQQLGPEHVTPALLFLVSDDAPSRVILCAGAGGYSRTLIHETEGIFLAPGERTPEQIAARFDELSSNEGQHLYEHGWEQSTKFVNKSLGRTS